MTTTSKPKKLTIKYWNTLSEATKRRAILCVFPIQVGLADMLIDEKPNLKNPWWQMIFAKIKIPTIGHYKFICNQTYYM